MLDTHLLIILLLVVLVAGAIFAAPTWGYSRGWGPYPSGLLGVVVLILFILLLLGRL